MDTTADARVAAGGSAREPSSAERLFAGPGEMRRRYRDLDWAATPLGAVDGWPQRLRCAVELMLAMPQPAYIGWGRDTRTLYNDHAIPILGARHPHALGKPYREVWPEIWEEHRTRIEATMRGEGHYFVDQLVALAGRPVKPARWFTFSWTPLCDDQGAVGGFFCVATETTERLRERDTLRLQLLQAEEDERRRLSRELHDETAQHLTALGLGLHALSDVASPGSDVDRRAMALRELVTTMGRELHAIAVRLRPRALDDFGLEAALAAYAEEWSRQTGIPVDVHADRGAERLPSAVESTIYRIVQEALTNVARHSGATHAGVAVERIDGHVHTIIEDDGRGFEPAAVSAERLRSADLSGHGLGLLGIRERAELLAGTVEIESAPGCGTTIFARIPITGQRTARQSHAVERGALP